MDADDYHHADVSWYAHASTPTRFYAARHVGSRRVYLHRIIARAQPGDIVDHINGDSLDNRRGNLRITSQAENVRNCARSREGGAYFDKRTGRWFARVQWDGKRIMLGRAPSQEDAQARVKMARELLAQGVPVEDVTARISAQVQRSGYDEV